MPLIHDVIIRTKPEKTLHKWQQPEGDLDKIIDVFTRLGDLILDPCAGSGTTLAVCLKKGRRCIGIELDEENVEVIKGRLTKVKHELTVQGIKGSVAEVAQEAA